MLHLSSKCRLAGLGRFTKRFDSSLQPFRIVRNCMGFSHGDFPCHSHAHVMAEREPAREILVALDVAWFDLVLSRYCLLWCWFSMVSVFLMAMQLKATDWSVSLEFLIVRNMLWSVWFLCSLVYRLRVTFEKQSSAASDVHPGTSCAAQPFSVQCWSLQVGQKGCLDHRSTYPQEILAREFDGWRLEKDHHGLRLAKKYCLFRYRCFMMFYALKFLKNRSSPSIDAFHIFLQPPKDYQDVNSTLTPFCTAPRWVRVKRRVSGERHWHFWKRWRRKVWRCATPVIFQWKWSEDPNG